MITFAGDFGCLVDTVGRLAQVSDARDFQSTYTPLSAPVQCGKDVDTFVAHQFQLNQRGSKIQPVCLGTSDQSGSIQ